MQNLQLDLSGIKESTGRVVLPTGRYNAKVVEAEVKQTAKGGHMLVLNYQVIDGEYAGSNLVERMNIVNANADAQRMALSSLKTLLVASGHKNPNFLKDTGELIGLQFNVKVDEEATSFTGNDGSVINTTQNEFKDYYAIEDAPVATAAPVQPNVAAPAIAPQVAPVAAAPASAPAAGAFPWGK